MKKLLTLSIAALALMAFMAAPSFAGDCAKTDNAKTASADKTCASKTSATMTSADKAACATKGTMTSAECAAKLASMTDAEKAACAAACASGAKTASMANMTEEQCRTLCAPYGENAVIRMVSIEGMTCGGCENAVKTALTEMEGVYKVAKVCHKSGMALVVVDKTKAKDESLTKMVANKGFKAEIIPAVASVDAGKVDGATCSAAKNAEKTATAAH